MGTTHISAVKEDLRGCTDRTGRGSRVSIKYITQLKLVFIVGRRARDENCE